MSEVIPRVFQTEVSVDRRSGKLHKQPEIEEDDASENTSTVSGGSTTVTIASVSRGILTSTLQPTSSSSVSSPDESETKMALPPANTRNKTLIRGHALEGASPPPPNAFTGQISQNEELQNGRLVGSGTTGVFANKSGKLRGQSHEAKDFLLASHKISNDSGHGTLDHTDDASDTSALSQDSSLENASVLDVYKDSSGINIPKFMRETLLKSAKDRKAILSIEDALLSFVESSSAHVYKMAEMSSYDRMIVHRLAAFLGLEHNVDSTGKCVILNRTENTRSVKLSEVVLFGNCQREPKKKILLKKPASFDEKHSRGSNKMQFGSHRAKSLEERQQNYNEARERIFKNDENLCDEETETNNLLTVNFVPHSHHSESEDSTKPQGQTMTKWVVPDSSSHQATKWVAGESSGNVPHTDNSNTSYNPATNQLTSSHMPPYVTTPSDLQQVASLALDTSSSSIPQCQPHLNHDGSLYHFDTTCPPPFIVQSPTHPPPFMIHSPSRPPPMTPPTGHVMCPSEVLSDITSRFGASSISSLDQGSESYTVGVPDQPAPVMSTFLLPPQSAYNSAYPPQITQDQLYIDPSVTQHPVQYIAIPYPQGQPFLDGQGHTTVPMPAVGIPTGAFQMVGSPYQPVTAVGSTSPCVDLNTVSYHYRAAPEPVVVGGAPHLVLAYTQPPLQQQQNILPSHQAKFLPAGNTPQGTYYTIPASTPTPPLSLTQPPPPSNHPQHHHQPTVFYTTNLGNPLTYPNLSSSSTTPSLKPVPTPFLQTQYTPQQQLHPHQPLMVSPPNGHHPVTQLTLNFNPSMTFNPAQPVGPAATAHGQQFLALQTNPYQIRPLGTTLYQLAGSPMVQTPQIGICPQLQAYQLFRPAGSMSDVRLVNPSSFVSRLSPAQVTHANTQQSRPRSSNPYRQTKKWAKNVPQNSDDCQALQGASTPSQTGHVNIMAPLSVSGCIPLKHTQLPSYSSNRQ